MDVTTRREIAQHLTKNAISVVAKTTLAKMCKSESKRDSRRPRQANGNRCSHKCRVHEINEECQDDMENLTEQVQLLFYS